MKDGELIKTLQEVRDTYLTSKEGIYLAEYLKKLGVSTVIIEHKYVDKDYLIDYSNFYSRSFYSYPRFTKRLHFFSIEFSKEDFKKALVSNDWEWLKKEYKGFTVIKPVFKENNTPLIGRTLIKTFPEEVESDKRYYISEKYPLSLYGIPLEIDTLPFKTQDIAVGACATTGLWVCQYPFNKLFDISILSSYEITEKAIKFPAEFRNFPSGGLSFEQMLNFIKSMELDAEVIDLETLKKSLEKKDLNFLLSTLIKAYLNCGLPVIATLCLEEEEAAIPSYHAVVISGYRTDRKGNINEIYVHDDRIGPYSRALFDDDMTKWENEWITKYGYSDLTVQKLLVPLYHKIRLPFRRIYYLFYSLLSKIDKNIRIELLLENLNSYKKFILENDVIDKKKILFSDMPRFLWVFRAYISDELASDLIFDGTAVFPRQIGVVYYR
ncbi:MAG: hypothetical protein U9N35_00850 [Euryarchaeota archaeon]|nr:hypothetical protein [Euryarchaeota archaeon]